MSKVKITLPDDSVREYDKGIKVYDIARDISEGLARVVVGAKVNGDVVGLKYEIDEDANVSLLKFDDEDGSEVFRHTSAHMLAQAVTRLFPDVKLAIGPAIKDGYYYDFDTEHRFTPEDLEKIEKEMENIAKEDLELERFELSREEALKFLKEKDELYKVELVEGLPEDS